MNDAEFDKFARMRQGINSTTLSRYESAEGNQVMAAVDGGELIGDPLEERLEDILVGGIVDHCVVVLSIAHFMDAWKDSDYYCVIISR